MVNSPVFGIANSKAATASTPSSIATAPLAPVAPTILPGATAYNSSLDWTEGTGGTRGCNTQTLSCTSNYSPETQITSANIGQLQVSYIFPIPSTLSSSTPFATRVPGLTYSGNSEGTQVATLTSNGIGYTLTNYLDIFAFNLATGAAAGATLSQPTPTSCTVGTGQSLGSVIAAAAKALPAGSPTPCIGSVSEMFNANDFTAWLKNPMASGGPTHDHSWNIVNVGGSVGDVAWVGGFGCSILGWQVATGALVANLTGMCGSAANPVPGSIHPVAGSGKMTSNGNGPVQVVPWDNEIVFWASGSSEGSGGFPAFTYACSLSLALSQYVPGTGSTCAPNYTDSSSGGACNTVSGGVCSSGSTMLWRTFTMPAYSGANPNFAVPYCTHTPNIIWIAGVPCSAIMAVNANIIAADGQRPDLAVSQDQGDAVFPSTGCSNVWGQLAIDPKDNIIAEGTGDTGPDWNDTLRMGFSIFCNADVAFNLSNGAILWSNKSFTKDINDQDCNLNTVFTSLGPAGSANNPTAYVTGGGSTVNTGSVETISGVGTNNQGSQYSATPINDIPMNLPLPSGGLMPNGGGVFIKQCKSGVGYAMNAITGQPLWWIDPSMPDYTTINSATTSQMSRPLLCSATNATACDSGKIWDAIAHRINENSSYPNNWLGGANAIKMQGTNPHPHGFINGGLMRGSPNLDPLNNTEVGTCTGVGTTNNSCNPGFTCPTGSHAACIAADVQGKGNGYYEERYIGETETSIDPSTGIWVTSAMTGPAEHDWIGDVAKQGQSGNVSGISLYFAGLQQSNSTVWAIQISTGQLLWYFQRPIYYRGSVLTFGGMVMAAYPDGHLDFINEQTGALLRDINVGIPLLAPNSIAPDANGVMHILVSYGGANHGNLGNPSIHGALGRGQVTTGGIISYVLGPATAASTVVTTTTQTVTSTGVTTITGSGGSVTTSTFTTTSVVSGSATVTATSIVTTSIGTSGVSNLAFYGAVGVAAILAIVAGALVVLRRRPSA